MKTSVLLTAAALIAVSSFASAKAKYFDGQVENIDTKNKTISVISKKTKELVTYKYADDAKYKTAFGITKEISSVEKGESVKLKVEDVK